MYAQMNEVPAKLVDVLRENRITGRVILRGL
jgi:hypothetical protein